TGLSDTINLNNRRTISVDTTVVSRVWLEPDAIPFFTPLRLRGAVYDRFRNNEWLQARREFLALKMSPGGGVRIARERGLTRRAARGGPGAADRRQPRRSDGVGGRHRALPVVEFHVRRRPGADRPADDRRRLSPPRAPRPLRVLRRRHGGAALVARHAGAHRRRLLRRESEAAPPPLPGSP